MFSIASNNCSPKYFSGINCPKCKNVLTTVKWANLVRAFYRSWYFFLVVLFAPRHPLLSPGVALLLTSLGIWLTDKVRANESATCRRWRRDMGEWITFQVCLRGSFPFGGGVGESSWHLTGQATPICQKICTSWSRYLWTPNYSCCLCFGPYA